MNRIPAFLSGGAIAGLRRFLAASPLFPPLLAVIGILAGGWGWYLAIAALLATALARQWKTLLLLALASTYAGWKYHQEETRIQLLRDTWHQTPPSIRHIEGTVTRSREHSAILETTGGDAIELLLPETISMQEGERWNIRGLPADFPPPPLPGLFDRSAWLGTLGVACRLRVIEAHRQPPASWQQRLLTASRECRRTISSLLMSGAPPDDPAAQFIAALLLGDKEHADTEIIENFRRSGCLHAFAVSGLHVGIIALLLGGLLRLCHCSPFTKNILLLLLLGGYIFVTGMPVSAVRAYLMIAAFLLARLLQRDYRLLNIWSFAALALLLWNPRYLFQPGFQLSFAVYAAICAGACWSRTCRGWFEPDDYIPFRLMTGTERLRQRWGRSACGLFIVSVCAWLAALPLCIFHFHAVSTWGIAANILLAPLLPVVMGLGVAALCLSWCPAALLGINWLNRHIADLTLQGIAALSGLPAAYIPATSSMPQDSIVIMTFTHGSHACLLGNPGLLIDCGTADNARWTVAPVLFHLNGTPGLFLATHAHARQTGGAETIRQAHPGIISIDSSHLPPGGITATTPAGTYTIIPASPQLPHADTDDEAPIVLWETGKHRTLYIGDASLRSLLRLPSHILRADTIILGRHTRHPADDIEWLRATGASRIIMASGSTGGAPMQEEPAPAVMEILPARSIHSTRADTPTNLPE